jgi:hypothetical protein
MTRDTTGPVHVEPRIAQLIQDLASEVEEVRKFAVIGLARTRDPSVKAHLEPLTEDPSLAVRYFARLQVDEGLRRANRAATAVNVRVAFNRTGLGLSGLRRGEGTCEDLTHRYRIKIEI